MKQEQVTSIPLMLVRASKILGALDQFAVSIGLHHVTKAIFESATNELLEARDSHESAKVELAACRAREKTFVLSAHEFVTGARDVMKRVLGKRYSQAWDVAGFRNSLEVPRSADKLQALMQSWKTFFENNPTLEVPPLNLTAVYAENVLQGMIAAKTSVNLQLSAVNKLINVRNAKSARLQQLTRALLDELGIKLNPLDPLWLAFGFNQPGAEQAPPAPENVTVVLIAPNALSVRWDRTPRAKYHRVWLKVNGVDSEMRPIGSPSDRDFTIDPVPMNAILEIAITANNDAGESLKSAIVTKRVGDQGLGGI